MTMEAKGLSRRGLAGRALAAMAALLVGGRAAAMETRLTDPKPSFDQPRRIILQLTSGESRDINNLLYNAVNIQKFYGMDNVRIAVIAYGDGMKALYAGTSPVVARIQSLLQYDIAFVACGNTMTATGRKPGELIDGVEMVRAGIPEIVERTLRGWTYITP